MPISVQHQTVNVVNLVQPTSCIVLKARTHERPSQVISIVGVLKLVSWGHMKARHKAGSSAVLPHLLPYWISMASLDVTRYAQVSHTTAPHAILEYSRVVAEASGDSVT
jgi:hypothetical protein